jgi:hypothetical protein
VKEEFVGDAGDLAGIALSTSGRQVIAYLCDGTSRHVSLAQWFTGPVTGTAIDVINARGAHLAATVTTQAITGTVTLSDGRSAPFTARLLPDPGSTYGLFRSERAFGGVRYLGGWILNPPRFASARVGAGTSAEVSLTAALLPDPTGLDPQHGRHRHHQRADRGADRQSCPGQSGQRHRAGPGHVPAHPLPPGALLRRPDHQLCGAYC